MFLKADAADHRDLVGDAIERAKAYADANANGFFIPGLGDLALVERFCTAVALPINAMHFPAAPTRSQWAAAGVARISHGPFPQKEAMAAFTEAARAAMH